MVAGVRCSRVPPRGNRLPSRALASHPTMDYWERWLDIAGHNGSSLALLPETFNGADPGRAEAAGGPASTLLSEKARRWRMVTCGTRMSVEATSSTIRLACSVMRASYWASTTSRFSLSRNSTKGSARSGLRSDSYRAGEDWNHDLL